MDTVLVGAGGFGANFVDWIVASKHGVRLVGVVDPYAKTSARYENFKHLPVYDTLQEYFAKHTAELTVISSPIHLHLEQCLTALENGSHVMCEKPLVPTVADLDILDKKIAESGKTLSVGFQWCFSPVMLAVKERILAGEFGKPSILKCYISWPRHWDYYARNKWAGKIKTDTGQVINDSIASNATAHYIQNMLFLLGPSMEESADLQDANTELWRANDIESFDTITLQGKAGGGRMYFAASHATNYLVDPVMHYTFEKATIFVNMFNQDYDCVIHHNDGRIENLGHALAGGDSDKVDFTALSIRGEKPWVCTSKTVRPITQLIDDIFSNLVVKQLPGVVNDENLKATYVPNLHLDLWQAYCEEKAL